MSDEKKTSDFVKDEASDAFWRAESTDPVGTKHHSRRKSFPLFSDEDKAPRRRAVRAAAAELLGKDTNDETTSTPAKTLEMLQTLYSDSSAKPAAEAVPSIKVTAVEPLKPENEQAKAGKAPEKVTPPPTESNVQTEIPLPTPAESNVQTEIPLTAPAESNVQEEIPLPPPAESSVQEEIPLPVSAESSAQAEIPLPPPTESSVQEEIPLPVSAESEAVASPSTAEPNPTKPKREKTARTESAFSSAMQKVLHAIGAFLKKHWPLVLKPITVLLCICLVISLALAITNYYTAPVIAENARIAANSARQALLPSADDFTLVEGEWEGVSEAYMATNGVGYVITGTAKGFGGIIPVMVAFDSDGNIIGIEISGTEETQGQGSKIEDAAFKTQFAGLPAEELTLNTDVDQVAGATVSSKAAVLAVNNAINAYQAIMEG